MKFLILLMLIFLSACSNQSVIQYKNETPKLELRDFFNGKIQALGIVQDRSGKVVKRFNVDIDASWQGDTCTLDEKFVYSDNTKSTRVWKLKELASKTYEGQAHDVVGIAKGEVSGNAFYFEYVLDLPVGDSHYNVHFEDWMFLLDSKTLLAKTQMTKWGIKVGEVTIVMSKKDNK